MRHDLVGAGLEQRENLLVRHRRRDARARRAGAAAGAFRPLPDFASSTSRAMTRPCGPVPVMRPSSMPASFARRRASGDEKMRPWPLACARVTRPRGAGAAAGFGAGAAAGAAAAGWRRRGASACGGRRRSSRLGAAGRGAGGLHVLAVAGEHRDHVVDRHILRALGHQDLGDRALVDRLDLHGRLVGLDLGDHVAGLDLVAFLLEPLGKVALFHRGRQRGHQDVDRHCQ